MIFVKALVYTLNPGPDNHGVKETKNSKVVKTPSGSRCSLPVVNLKQNVSK